jgi:hypothetical protein
MGGKHAILSPSSASRWLECTPSARLEQQFPDKSGEAAQEGTLAHSLGELLIQQKLGFIVKKSFDKKLKEIQANKFYDVAMHEHCDNYAVHVIEKLNEAKSHTSDAELFLEHTLDLTEYLPEGFGTGDSIIIANHILDITDFKYGKGVAVTAENNKQMMVYGLGALCEFGILFDIRIVRMTIFQPRLDIISVWEIPVEELRNWAETELKPRAALAFAGEGEYIPGHHCKFCKAKNQCKALANHNLELAKYDFKDPNLLTDQDVSDIIGRAKVFTDWLKGLLQYALVEAVNHGKVWPGYKIVEGKSNRTYSDQKKVGEVLMEAGFSEELIYKKELVGITDMTKNLGTKKFKELVECYLIKPSGKPTLAPISDKRLEFNGADKVALDFAEDI